MRTTLPAMPASDAFAAWYQSYARHSIDEVVSLASGLDADAWAKLQAELAAMLQTAFEAGRQSAEGAR
ncbi:MAG: hypothetical protein ACRDNZ_22705 [Streptosporangiaceae bacterium]